jgi:hypothetical protein
MAASAQIGTNFGKHRKQHANNKTLCILLEILNVETWFDDE